MNTTLNEIREHSPCRPSWEKLLKALGKTQADDEPLTFRIIYDILGPEDLIWCSLVLGEKDRVYLGASFAQTVAHLTDDERVHECIKICFEYAKGEATKEHLENARNASYYAAAAYAARAAADAFSAAYAARAAAYAAAYAAAAAASAAVAVAAAYAARAVKWEELAKIMLDYVEEAND